MLHEIQPGDVVIVTLACGGNQKCTDSIGKHLADMGAAISADIFVGSNATETSVHVIRAKKAEDKPRPEPQLSCARCGTPATTDFFCMCGKPGCVGCCKKRQSEGWPAWRDAKVEKPPPNADCLACDKHGDVWLFKHKTTTVPDWITHWMPLPEGPK